jgi:hypothetical protein
MGTITLDELRALAASGDEDAISDVAEWDRWQAAASTAAQAACSDLTARGIGYAYGRGGGVYRRNPDGSETELCPFEG